MVNKNTLIQSIDRIYREHKPAASIKKGNKVNPLHILSFSKVHSSLNFQNEELMLACYSDAEKPHFLLTENSLYLIETGKSLVLPLDSQILENPKLKSSSFSDASISDQSFLTAVFAQLFKRKEKKKTLDDFLNKYKSLVNKEQENFNNPELFFDGKYIEMLAKESEVATDLCTKLEEDKSFSNALNLLFKQGGEANEGYNVSHILLYDLIKAYNLVDLDANEKAKFTLAYFFEKLQGNDLGKGISIDRLNKLTTQESFEENIQKIKDSAFINLGDDYKNEFVLPSLLLRLKHPLFDKAGNLIYHFASIVTKADNTVSDSEKEKLKEILKKCRNPKKIIEGIKINEVKDDDSLESVMQELNELIGLEEVKKGIADLTNFLKIQAARKEQGLKASENSLHSVFMGPPGTGKTTVARLLARIYKHLGYLEGGHLVETDRAGLVAGYVGQTAIKVNEVVEQSKGGVLFIDEAYSLVPADPGRDFGQEAIETLLKRMEDLRDDFVVVAAGYSEPMKYFIESNPGLRSRFNRYYTFQHFLPTQLLDIFKIYCKKGDFETTEAAEEKLLAIFDRIYERRDEGFGNARSVRNLFEKIIEHQANRLVEVAELTKELLVTIEEEDVPEILKTVESMYATQIKVDE